MKKRTDSDNEEEDQELGDILKPMDHQDDQNRQKEKQIIRLLSEPNPIEQAFVQEVTFSALFNPAELRGMVQSHNELCA